ncbi:MAG TPA: phosphotransferase [Candidatus Acidoferrum sp.]|nr:phosphotransferase [Candidatus Acidoferrum sp.]
MHAFDRLAAELQTTMRSGVQRLIHGSPHRQNVLLADGEPRFIDFETVCVGPIEWDLAHLAPEVAVGYGEALNKRLERAATWQASRRRLGAGRTLTGETYETMQSFILLKSEEDLRDDLPVPPKNNSSS